MSLFHFYEIARELRALRTMQFKRRGLGKGVSNLFKECPRGTTGRRALRRLKDANVARALSKLSPDPTVSTSGANTHNIPNPAK